MSTLSSQIANLSPEQLAKLAYELKASKARKAQELPKRVPGEPCPLSFAQQRLWFIAQLEPDNPAYNCMEALRMTGKLNVPLLEQTFSEVVRRHEALRTTFELVGGEPAQIVSSEIKLNSCVIDLESLPESERERQVSKLSSEALRRPFDLTRGPLLRVVVLRVNEQEHAILFTTHHITSDGWSLDIIVREIIALYLAFVEGRPSPLAELPIQYADFAIWQRQRLTGPVLEEHLEYWRQHLEGAPHVLALPTDRPRPAILTRRGSCEILKLSPELSHSVRALSRREGVTLFMTMLAAFDVLLSRYSGQTDFLIGTDIANRNHSTTESLIGFLVNQLVLRVDLTGDPTFNELLERVKEVTLDGYAHQEAPFEKLVEMLNPKRNLQHAPLFQVKLVLQNASTGNLELPELALSGGEAESAIAKFDLTLVISEGDRISAEMEYSTDLFESSTIGRMLRQFERLLASAVRDPEQHISQLELLSSAERQQLLVARNDTHVPYPHTRCIHELFEEQVALTPEAPALTFQGQHLSYAELNARANQLAHYLRELGVKAETPVGICLNRSLEMVVAVFAVLKAGGIYIPLDPQYPAERLFSILEEAQPSIILTDSVLLDELPSTAAQGICVDTEQEWWATLADTNLSNTDLCSENLAHVLYTSGSTGKPKGVAVPHRGVVRLVKQETYVSYGPDEVFLQMGSLSFDASTLEIFSALLTGGRLVLLPPGAPSLDDLAAVLTSEGVSKLWVTAGLFHPLVEHQVNALAGVRDVMSGGDVLSVEHVRRLLRAKAGQGSVINGYGPTESTVFTCCHRIGAEEELERGVPIGKPIGNTQVYVLGEKLELLGDGMVGELYIGGDGLARCYYNQPELTAERFVPHPFSIAGGERLYRSGDYVRWRAEGLMEFVGRVDTQVKIRGYRIEPGEVEAVLGRHASVSDGAVVARQEGGGEKYLVAYVVTKANGHSESSFELKEYLRQQLPEFMIPAAIVVIESLPLTPNGKVDRRELAAREVRVGSERPYASARTTTEELLCDIWQEVLHAERVGIDDNFFDLGGDSILTIRVIVKARAAGLELDVQQLFQYQTVRELAEELARAHESAAPVLETEPFSLISEPERLRMPAGVVDAYPLTALQAGMLFHGELVPEAGQYHDIFTFHLRMPLKLEALRATLQQLLEQHPVLRTSFNLSDFSEPLQLVHQEVAVPLQFGDLRALSPMEQEEYLTEWMVTEKQRRFDWRKAPLLRFQIERRDEESFQFSFSFHHAILDGWSVATMLTELFNIYSVLQTGAGASVAAVSALFRDYVAAERAVLNSEAAQQYWMTMLSEAPHSRLPRLGPGAGPSRVAVEQVELSAELSLALKELARRAGVPLKSVLLAAHLRALNVLTGSSEVVTGIVSHGRPETTDGERVLGLFLNTLPFRRHLTGGTWLDLVQETFAAERELLPFRRYPMARMQQELGNEAPLFEVIFNFVHFHVYEELQNVSGLEVLGSGGVAETNYTFGVDFSLELAGSQIRLELHYDAAELSAEQIAAVGRNYRTILESMTRQPLERYEQQSLLSPEERQTILYQWNEPALSGLDGECYQHLFETQVVRAPNALAAALGAEQLTYDELNRRANQLAHYLKALGVGPEVPVAVFLERSLETLVALLAIFKAGGAYVPLDPEYPDERLRFMMRDAGPELLVTQEKFSSRLADQVVKSIRMDADWPEIANESQENPPFLASASTLAYIIYTSGSSGTPKGVMITQGGMINCLQGAQQRYGLTAQDSFLMHISLSFDASVWEVFWPLMVGGRVVIAPAEGMLENRALLSYIAEQSVTCASFVPSLLGVLVKDRLLSEMSSLRYVLTGAEKLPLEVMREFQRLSGAELHNVYGPTETTLAATEWACEAGAERVLIGRPIGNTQVYVLDGQMEPLPVGVARELYIGGAGVGRGYAGQAALTAERFVPDRFSGKAGARLYRTGDLVRYDQQGVLEFVGRVDEQVKLRGYRIELGEIEAVLRGHQQVRAAVVVMREEERDKRLVAYVVSEVSAGELRAYLQEQLPDYMVPSVFVALNELPLLPNGKLDRRALPALENSFAAAAEYEAPRTPTEELLCGFWASVLQVNRVGINDNFFELGGHSLLAIKLISRIRDAFGVELPLRELFERRTVAELAQSVDDQMRASHELVLPPLRPAVRDDVLPLSFAQQRLWFLDQLVPENIAYTAAEVLRLRGALNLAALEQSINEVMRRHEGLRTTFPDVDGNPIQVITPFRHLALPLIDLSSLLDEDREAQAVRIASAEAQRPFNLQSGPLMRATLLRLRAEDHVLVFSMHHIISDEWSTAILAREVGALYDAFTTGNASPLTDLTIQYGDFAVWQRQWLSGDVLARQLDYWTSKLQGVPALFALPTDYARPKVQLTEGALSTHLFSAELTSDLKLLAQQSKATLYMTVLAAFHALLHRYAQQSTVVTGTVVANRTRMETEPLIGFFVNTLAVRSDFDDDPTFLAHLSLLRKHALEAYAHQDLPFEMLVDELRLARDLSYHPLFQVMFSWEEAALDELALKGLELSTVAVENHTSQFDLTLRVGEVNGQLRCGMQYNTALFEASTVGRMLTQFERLLASAVRDPEQHISQLELLSSAERQQLLVARNDTQVPYPRSRCIHELFEEQVALAPEAPALTFHGQHLSYAELNARANQLAHYLRELGVKAETPVGVCLNRSLEMVVAVVAILKAGGIYIPLDPQYPAERLFSILEEAQPSIILTTASLFEELPSTAAQGICVDTDQEWWATLPDTNLTAEVSSENLAHVLYTSGSTGKPKGVAVPHRGVVRLVKQETYVSYGPDEVFLQMGSLSFDASTLEIFSALLTGGRLVLLPPGAPSLDELAAVLTSEGVSKLWVTAGLFHPLVEHEVNALAGVRDVMSGGDVLSVEHVRRLLRAKAGQGSVINGYGPTESTVFTCCHRIGGEEELERGVPIGKPIGNTQVYVLGEKLELLADGMVGELYIGGDGLARCYYNQPELTAERFVPHPFSIAGGERLYRSGDYVRWRAEGLMEFVGRVDTQVKIRGYRIEPGEVEAVLGRHASVSDCAVVARQEGGGEKYLVAYVVTKANGHSESSFELREYLRQQLPEFMIPAAIVVIESLPLTANGKVDRRELAAREVRVGSERPYAPARTTTEELLCDIWQEVLHAERVGIDDNFFDLGGDSILTIRVIVKARAAGLELDVQQLFQYQTVRELAEELARAHESAAPVLETEPFSLISEPERLRMPAGVVDAYPLTALQAGMLFHGELVPEAGQYHDIFTFHLRMPLNLEALRATLQQLLEQHPVLRTSFNLSDFSEPLQLVHQEVAVPLQFGDLRALSPMEQEEYLTEWIATEKQRRFDWRKAPLLRFQIERRDEESFQFSFSFHHAILDGWSVATMLTELFNLYSVLQTGAGASVAAVNALFRDYVAAERAVLNSEEAQQYWMTMLSEAPHSRLPRLGPSAGPSRVAVEQVELSAELSLALKELARRAGVPLKSVLLAAHLRALNVLTGSNDVVTGIVSHGRPETTDGERVLGLFLNTLPFRRHLTGGTWLDLVQETFAAERELLPFRRYPMARMQQELGNEAPLFEVIFNFMHFHVYEELQNVSGLEVLGSGGVAETNFTLAVHFSLELAGLQIKLGLQYDAAELSAEQIAAVGRNYRTILESMTRQPLERYQQQCLLSPEERQTILYQWNDTRVAYDLKKCIHQLFEAQVSRTPDAVAVVDGDTRLSYGDLEHRAQELARRLRHERVGPEQRVGILAGRGAAMVVAVLGVLKAGGAYVPLDAAYPLERLSLMVADAQLSVLVAEAGQETDFVRSDLKVVRLNGATCECIEDVQWESREGWQAPTVTPENLAYVIYTSGSTGRPKGVAITHRSAVAFIHWARDVFAPSALAGVLASTSLSFDLSVFELFVTLSAGGKIILADDALHLPTLEAAQEVTLINTVPSAMAELLRIGAVPARVQTINLAGEALPASLVQQIYQQTGVQRVWNLYGPSEDTTYSTSVLIEKNQSGPMVIGRPIANTQVYICDEMLQPMPVGVAGQLLLAGDGLARGYIGRPDLTAERFLPNPFSLEGGARLYVTGDLARYRADGQIEFLGRADSQLKLRGFRIEPGEIETRLREHPSVREAIVIATTEVDPDDKRLVAYVVTAHSGASVNDLRDYLRGTLPEYMVPSAFVLMNAFPLTPTGKIDRRALPLPDRATKSDSELTTPRDLLELQLIEIWKEVLRREQIGLRDNFFNLGGHSLLAMRLVDKVERLVEQKIPLSILFQGATVEQLAATLRQRGGKVREQLLVSIQPEGSRPPLFLVHSASGNVMSYVTLARRLGREQPVYGLQSKGLDPDHKPTARVEDMASEYLEELFAVQPDGPYFLGGWSMGGVIAFEMARQLTAQGKSVAPLVLIDSTIQTGRVKKNGLDDVSLLLALAQHHGLFLDNADHTFNNLRSLNLDEQLEFLLEKGAGYNQFPRDIGIPQLRHLFELFKVNVHATEHYRPAKSEQQVILLQAADALPRHAAETLKRWKKVSEVVEAHRLPGDHYSIVTEPHVAVLAEQIKSVLTA